MSDSFDAIFQAVRSSIRNVDVGQAVENVFSSLNLGHYFESSYYKFNEVISAYDRPSAIYRPRLAKDGDRWICCYGDNIQEGVVGIGKTPAEAMWEFDKNWSKP